MQVKVINGIIVDRDFLRQELSLTNRKVFLKDSLLFLKDAQIETYKLSIGDYKESLVNYEKIVKDQTESIKEYRKRALKKSLYLCGGGVLVGVIIGLLVK